MLYIFFESVETASACESWRNFVEKVAHGFWNLLMNYMEFAIATLCMIVLRHGLNIAEQVRFSAKTDGLSFPCTTRRFLNDSPPFILYTGFSFSYISFLSTANINMVFIYPSIGNFRGKQYVYIMYYFIQYYQKF